MALFGASGTDPIGKMVRVGSERYTVVGVFDKRPAVGGFNAGQDDFVVMPYTAYQRQFGLRGVDRRPRPNTRVLLADADCRRAARRCAADGRHRRRSSA